MKEKVIGIYPNGLTGLEITDIEHGIEDYIIFRDMSDNSTHKRRIYYNTKNTYFMYYNRRIPLSECMRI